MNKSVSDFYDDYSVYQKNRGYNERHFFMLDKMLELGVKPTSNILELGCGIGTITSLVYKVVKKGKIIGVDISPKSIEHAKKRVPAVEFHVGDIVKFTRKELSYDFVTLFDVLEHIPIELHKPLFANIVAHMNSNTKLLVNIPNPTYLDYVRENSPDLLQIIDQSLDLAVLIKDADESGLSLKYFEKYDLWSKDESQFMIFEPKAKYEQRDGTPPKQTLLRRIQNKFEIYW